MLILWKAVLLLSKRFILIEESNQISLITSSVVLHFRDVIVHKNPRFDPSKVFLKMYSKKEAGVLKQEFWTKFGQYMNPIPSSDHKQVNWINYKTGEKDIFIRMHADNKKAIIAFELVHKDPEIQEFYFKQFQSLQNHFNEIVGKEYIWKLHMHDDSGRIISKIYLEKQDVNIYNKSDWPTLIEFFKSNIIALDQFWNDVKYSFEMLR